MSLPEAFGSQFTISTQNAGAQYVTSATVLQNGQIVVVWQDGVGASAEIKYRILNADGSPAGAEGTANATATGQQSRPQVAALEGGGFAVVWQDYSSDAAGDVRYRVFGADGAPVTTDLLASKDASAASGLQIEPSIAALPGGGFVIAWQETNPAVNGGTNDRGIEGRLFGADGTPLGDPVLVSGAEGGAVKPTVSVDQDGNILFAWEDIATGFQGIKGVVLGGTGFPGTNSGIGRFDNDNTTSFETNPDVAITSLGAVAVWDDRQPGQTRSDVFVSINGGAPQIVHTTDNGEDQDTPKVAPLALGGFVVVWRDTSNAAGTGVDIRARVYDAAGNPTGPDFVVSEGAKGNGFQETPDVIGLIDGRFLIAWSNEGSSVGIDGRIFDPRTTSVEWTGGLVGEQFWGADLAGGDRLSGGGGNDSIFGQSGADTIAGDAGSDALDGGNDADSLTGGADADVLAGGAGNDTLDGGTGGDVLAGGAGNDLYLLDSAGDVIVEGKGGGTADRAQTSVSYKLAADDNIEALFAAPASAKTAIDLTGNGLAQAMTGNAGANRLDGGGGIDTLKGGLGADSFVFTTKLGAANVDRIVDFAKIDTIRLDDAIFKGIAKGTLGGTAFAANTSGRAADASDRIIYETDTGKLFYDRDGAGGSAAVLFAKLQPNLTLTSADFVVF
jgi:Ca2+-binding RTX toxin-like protein